MKAEGKNTPSHKVLIIAVEELRREHDELTAAYDHLRNKILTLLGGGLALLAFMYSNPSDLNNPLFVPKELYGMIFYFAGLILYVGALCVLLYATKPNGDWELAPENDELKKLSQTDEDEYLTYVKDRYVTCFSSNSRAYALKHKYLDRSFYPLVFGAIILLVIRLFGGLPK